MKSGIQIKPLSPNNISVEPKTWLDGKDSSTFSLDGTYVNNWACKGSLSADVKNTNNDTTRPTYDASTGRVTFTSANSTFLQSAAFGSALSQPNTIFIVYKITGALDALGSAFDGRAIYNRIYYNLSAFRIYGDGVPLVDGTTDTNDNIHCVLFNGANSEYRINGILEASGNVGVLNLDGITLGARYDLSQQGDVEIMEVICFSDILPEAEHVGIELYLGAKWGIL